MIDREFLEKLDRGQLGQVNDLVDGVNLQLMIIPLKPFKKSKLPAFEFGSLYSQISLNADTAQFHPLDKTLPLNQETLSRYYLDLDLIRRRDAHLQDKGCTLEQWLEWRGLTLQEYRKLLDIFQSRWRYRLADCTLQGLVLSAGIAGYLYGVREQALQFFPDIPIQILPDYYPAMRKAAAAMPVLNSAGLAWANRRGERNLAASNMILLPLLVSHLLYLADTLLLDENKPMTEVGFPLVISFAVLSLSKASIPMIQAGLMMAGKTFLRRFSLFNHDPDLLQTYSARPPLEHKPEIPLAPAANPPPSLFASLPCVIM